MITAGKSYENKIRELKEDFAMEGFPMKKFNAVEAAMVLKVLAYNLYLVFKHELPRKKDKK